MDCEKDPNTYDFDFESEYDEEFNPDNDPILNAFMEILGEAKEKYDNIPKMRIPNSQKLAEFIKSLKTLTKIIKESNPNAQIQYKLNDDFDIGQPSITIKSSCLMIHDMQKFIDNLKFSRCMDVDELNSGGVEITIGFNNIYDTYLEAQKPNSE